MTYRKLLILLKQLPSDKLDEQAMVSVGATHHNAGTKTEVFGTLPIKRFSPAIAFSVQTAKEIGGNHMVLVA